MQLLKVLDLWTEYLESGGQIDVISTDLEKAFDKASYVVMILTQMKLSGLHVS